jgi:hypothetical protein
MESSVQLFPFADHRWFYAAFTGLVLVPAGPRPRGVPPPGPGGLDRRGDLRYGLGVVLAFVGLKMVGLNRAFDGHFPITVSLGIIVGVIAASIVVSFAFPKAQEEPR